MNRFDDYDQQNLVDTRHSSWKGLIGIVIFLIVFGLIILAILQATGVTNIYWPDTSPHGWGGP